MTEAIESEPVDADEGWAVAACLETARRIGLTRWEMIRLVYQQGLSQREVANRLHIHESAVRSGVARGMRVMAEVVLGAGRHEDLGNDLYRAT